MSVLVMWIVSLLSVVIILFFSCISGWLKLLRMFLICVVRWCILVWFWVCLLVWLCLKLFFLVLFWICWIFFSVGNCRIGFGLCFGLGLVSLMVFFIGGLGIVSRFGVS